MSDGAAPDQPRFQPRRVVRTFPRNKSECVADILGHDIMGGRLRPGEALPIETVLLERFAVSRTALRDAFHLLAAKGLLEACPRRGTSVTAAESWHRLDPQVLQWQAEADQAATLRQIGQLRGTTYPAAAALAAQHREDSDLSECDRVLALLDEAQGDVVAFHRQSLMLPHTIAQAGRNDLFISISHLINGMLTPLAPSFDAAQHRDALRHGSAAVDAIRRRQPAAAETHMHAYLSALSAQAALRS